MFDPRSYIAQVAGIKSHEPAVATLPSFFEYTSRLIFLEEEQERLAKRIAEERNGWKSVKIDYVDSEYTVHYCAVGGSDVVEALKSAVADVAEEVRSVESSFTCFADGVREARESSASWGGGAVMNSGNPANKLYSRDVFLGSQLEKRFAAVTSLAAVLLERGGFYYLVKGEGCTVPIVARTDPDGGPVLYEGVQLDAEEPRFCNSIVRAGREHSSQSVVTVLGSRGTGGAAALMAAEAATDDRELEAVLRLYTDHGAVACVSCVYGDGTGFQYEKPETQHVDCSQDRARTHDIVAHRARVIRGSRNADAMHLLLADANLTLSEDARKLEAALRAPILVATMRTPTGPSYFEVLPRVLGLGDCRGWMLLAVERDSALYNNVYRKGDSIVLYEFADADVWAAGPPRQWLPAASCSELETVAGAFPVPRDADEYSAMVFTTEVNHGAGDSAVLVGRVAEIPKGQCLEGVWVPPFASELPRFKFTPFICRLVHRECGPIGVVGYGFTVCSTAPMLCVALLPVHVTEVISAQTDVDPAAALYFLRQEAELFTSSTFPEFTEQLPLPLREFAQRKSTLVAAELTCRLLHLQTLLEHSTVLAVLSVSHVSYDGTELLQFPTENL